MSEEPRVPGLHQYDSIPTSRYSTPGPTIDFAGLPSSERKAYRPAPRPGTAKTPAAHARCSPAGSFFSFFYEGWGLSLPMALPNGSSPFLSVHFAYKLRLLAPT